MTTKQRPKYATAALKLANGQYSPVILIWASPGRFSAFVGDLSTTPNQARQVAAKAITTKAWLNPSWRSLTNTTMTINEITQRGIN